MGVCPFPSKNIIHIYSAIWERRGETASEMQGKGMRGVQCKNWMKHVDETFYIWQTDEKESSVGGKTDDQTGIGNKNMGNSQ